jgi:hypothetical protein
MDPDGHTGMKRLKNSNLVDFEIVYMIRTVERIGTLIRKKIKFSSYIRKFRGIGCNAKSYLTNDLLINGENICALPHKYDFALDPI